MELAAICAGLLLGIGGLVVLLGVALRAWVAGHPSGTEGLARRAAALDERFRRLFGHGRVAGPPGRASGILVLELIVGLAAVTLTAVGAGALVEDVTSGDGVALLDHPVARYVAAHRTAALTSVMKAVSEVGGPIGMTVLALGAGLLLSLAWRSYGPLLALAVTAAGVMALTMVFKTLLGRARPPLTQAVAPADGYGFPSGHAAAAAAVLGAVAWLCCLGLKSWTVRIAACAAAAMLATLVGISRIYLGVHWTSDVLGGWAFGAAWLAIVVTGWTVSAQIAGIRR